MKYNELTQRLKDLGFLIHKTYACERDEKGMPRIVTDIFTHIGRPLEVVTRSTRVYEISGTLPEGWVTLHALIENNESVVTTTTISVLVRALENVMELPRPAKVEHLH